MVREHSDCTWGKEIRRGDSRKCVADQSHVPNHLACPDFALSSCVPDRSELTAALELDADRQRRESDGAHLEFTIEIILASSSGGSLSMAILALAVRRRCRRATRTSGSWRPPFAAQVEVVLALESVRMSRGFSTFYVQHPPGTISEMHRRRVPRSLSENVGYTRPVPVAASLVDHEGRYCTPKADISLRMSTCQARVSVSSWPKLKGPGTVP